MLSGAFVFFFAVVSPLMVRFSDPLIGSGRGVGIWGVILYLLLGPGVALLFLIGSVLIGSHIDWAPARRIRASVARKDP